jgi:hypothetical protein
MLEWLWPWVFALAPLPWLIHRFSKGESLQPSALRAPFAARWRGLSGASSQHKVRPRLLVATVAHMDDADRRLREATVDRRTH